MGADVQLDLFQQQDVVQMQFVALAAPLGVGNVHVGDAAGAGLPVQIDLMGVRAQAPARIGVNARLVGKAHGQDLRQGQCSCSAMKWRHNSSYCWLVIGFSFR